ncbi:amidohydrolase family protein [Nakamurella sp. UYEF19]|uniref:amidohydrolase family protein n=1 Tax=Nakamurella sp. UYEF19 TaxID=1756392 RepID=UPI00339B9D97
MVDIHVHFMPDNVLRKVWDYFDKVPPTVGMQWPIEYRQDESVRLATLSALGVTGFTALTYAHRAGMGQWLSDWAMDFGARTPGCVPSATFYPEPGVDEYVRTALDRGAAVFKSHVQVGAYDPRDELLDPVWGMIADAGVPVVCHCGSGPFPGTFTGPGPIAEVLRRHPDLTLVIAHAGSPEYGEFLDLVEQYPRVHLDTTMAFTPYLNALAPFPVDLVPRLADLGDRVVLGSDFPNIPHPFSVQIQSLVELDLGDDWLRAVLHHNGSHLLRHP